MKVTKKKKKNLPDPNFLPPPWKSNGVSLEGLVN